MSRFKFLSLFLILFLLNFPNVAKASQTDSICFRILWQSSSGVGPAAIQKEGVQKFINLNNVTEVGFTYDATKTASFDSNGKYTASYSRGCIYAGNFSLGNNAIIMNFSIFGENGMQAITEGYMKVDVEMELPSGSKKLIITQTFTPDPSTLSWSIPKTYHASLAELSPDLAAMVERKKQTIGYSFPPMQKESSNYSEDLKKYDAIMDKFADRSFLDLTEEELLAYQGARERYLFNKSKVEERNKSIAQKSSDLKQATELAKTQIQNAINAEGYDIKAEDLLQFDNSYQMPTFASVPMSDSGESSVYDEWANQAIQELQYQLDNGQRVAFLSKALHWQTQMDSLLKIVESRASLSREEFNAFEAAGNKVNAYLFGNGADQKGVLTEDFWFKDLNLDPALRSAIDNDLARYNPEQAKRIKAAINQFDKDIRLIIEHIKAASELAQMYKAAQTADERSLLDKMTLGLTIVIEKAPEMMECIALNSAAGPYADFYEFYYEKDFCTGKPNDEFDQAVAGISLVVEAGGLVFSGPAGSWVADKAEAAVKVVKKVVTSVQSAHSAKVAQRVEYLTSTMDAVLKTKKFQRLEDLKQLARGFPALPHDMNLKILEGAVNKRGVLIGAHSAAIKGNSLYELKNVVKNADGTTSCKVFKDVGNGKILSKDSTLFPDHWTDDNILNAIRYVAGSTPIATRAAGGATLHRQVVEGIEILVIREGTKVTSGYPTGMIGGIAGGFGL